MSLFVSHFGEKDFYPQGEMSYLGRAELRELDILEAVQAKVRKRKNKRFLFLGIIERFWLKLASVKADDEGVTHWDVWGTSPEGLRILKDFIVRHMAGKPLWEADDPAERNMLNRYEAKLLVDMCVKYQAEVGEPIRHQESGRDLLHIAYERLGLDENGRPMLSVVGAPTREHSSNTLSPAQVRAALTGDPNESGEYETWQPFESMRQELEEIEAIRHTLKPKHQAALDKEWETCFAAEAEELEQARAAGEKIRAEALARLQGKKTSKSSGYSMLSGLNITQSPLPAPRRSREDVRGQMGRMGLRLIPGGRAHAS